ncbi:MAG: tripartite tricarboxylate transporter substrate binding protein [Betaproteobacteria bacterium]|jgi:tripartite-type tricarboxylate transporter receptor subunit TctC|nr:tripartite tricarboxylate transporter substrate binding protein [Betaproteobacteria bacterium]
MCAVLQMPRPIIAVLFALPLVALPHAAAAQAYPAKPVRLIVPLAPGGTGDTLARLTADLLTSALGQPTVVDNRPGANGIIGMELVAQSAADGYTLLSGSSGNTALNTALHGSKLRYDVERDFAPVIHVATTTSVVVAHPALPVKTIPDLIALARSKPGTILYASAGIGSAVHLGNALFESMAGVRMNHVPYKGSTPGRLAVVQGEAHLMFDGLLPSLPLIKQGRLRPLAVTGLQRSTVLPELPTIAETLPGYRAETWYALFAPARTAPAIIKTLNAAVASGLKRSEVQQRLQAQGAEPAGSSPADLALLLKQETALWRRVIKEAGITAQ